MTDKYHIDGHKLNHHLDRVKDWNEGKSIAPLNIQLGISTDCNIKCQFCYPIMQGRTGKLFNMPEEPLMRLLKDSKDIGVKAIAFIGEGENTLNPYLYDALEYAKKINLNVSLATNGVKIREDKIDTMLDSLSWLRINISASTPELYKVVHGRPFFNKVINNIEKLVTAKRKNNHKVPIGLQFVMAQYNMSDIVSFAKLGRDLNVDNVAFKPVSDTYDRKLDSPLEKYADIEDVYKEAESFSNENYDVVIKRSKIKEIGIKNYDSCFGTEFMTIITGRGDVFPCCHFAGVENKEEYKMGNIIQTSLSEIVKSERYNSIQKKIQKINVNTDCESNCGHHYINQFLWDIKTGKIDLDNYEEPKNKVECENFI